MENIFIVKQFESGWEPLDLLEDLYAQEEYCVEVLDIPDEKIYGTEMITKNMMEIILTGLRKEELSADWYTNLNRISA